MSETHTERLHAQRKKDFLIPAFYAMRFRHIGPFIRALRNSKGLSLYDFEDLHIKGLDRTRLSKLENNHMDISRATLGKIMTVLGCPNESDPIEWFFTELKKIQIDVSPSARDLV